MFDLLFDIAGRPPGPVELGHMTLRNIIKTDTNAGQQSGLPSPDPTATTFEQGIAESDIKTKWTSALWALQEYVPPPRMIGGLLEKGGISVAQAKTYWQDSGVPALTGGRVCLRSGPAGDRAGQAAGQGRRSSPPTTT